MKFESASPEDYISQLPEERKEAVEKLRQTVKANLPAGFQETMSYGMITYVVPHELYPPGYHVNPEQPLPFISIASQKELHCTVSYGNLHVAHAAGLVSGGVSEACSD